MAVLRRAAAWAMAAVAGVTVLGTASSAQAGARAEEKFSFTAEKFSAVQFGTDKADLFRMLGVGQTRPGSAEGWCEDDGDSVLCMTKSDDYAPYGRFSYNAAGKVWRKHHELLFKPKAPSISLAQYNQVRRGMTEAQLWAAVPKDSCVLQDEEYPNWPATTGRTVMYWCTSATGLFPPNARFYLTDGKVTQKYEYKLA
ncbi:BLIP family protein [Streptomyces sp. URMC 126]|uniref:BLIP family protein n=1 Tax=Streptomyces sp. URMC 126 TaxID=3423401 RepID=UPI003F196371